MSGPLRRSHHMRICAFLVAPIALSGCGNQEIGDVGDGFPGEVVADVVEESGRLDRLAVTVNGQATELPRVRSCTTPGSAPAESDVVAPRCGPVDAGTPPAIGARAGSLLEVTTGENVATVTLAARGSDAYVDADPLDGTRQRWRVRVPGKVEREGKLGISVSPLRTDSRSLQFDFVLGEP